MSDKIMENNHIYQGDAFEVMQEIPESSVHAVITSPPYYGLRDDDKDAQIGLELSMEEYVTKMVKVGREIQRVLRDDGSWWLNLGDSYSGSGRGEEERITDLKRKSKMLIPYRVAVALQADGWIARNDVVWKKTDDVLEFVSDRLAQKTERLFHLVQNPEYWYNLHAIREPHKTNPDNYGGNETGYKTKEGDPHAELHGGEQHHGQDIDYHPDGKNPGDIEEVPTSQFSDAHFSEELLEKPIKATCPSNVCAECGEPCSQNCECETDETDSGIVLDPFIGVGTTALAAKSHGRRYVGIELNENYADIARARLDDKVDNSEHLEIDNSEHLENTSFNKRQEVSPINWGEN